MHGVFEVYLLGPTKIKTMLAQTFFATFCVQKYKNKPCQFWAWRESNLGFEIHMDDRNNQLIILGGPVNLNLPLSVKICKGWAPGRRSESSKVRGSFFQVGGRRTEGGGRRRTKREVFTSIW